MFTVFRWTRMMPSDDDDATSTHRVRKEKSLLSDQYQPILKVQKPFPPGFTVLT